MGKILSEASQSIIGMLSAKPVGMETRTANNEFSSLLATGEDRPRSALDKDGAETAEGNDAEQFLAQLIGNDDQSVTPSEKREMVKTVTMKIAGDDGVDSTQTDASFSPEAASEMQRFVSVLQPSSGDSTQIGKSISDIEPKRAPNGANVTVQSTKEQNPGANIDTKQAPMLTGKQLTTPVDLPAPSDIKIATPENGNVLREGAKTFSAPKMENDPVGQSKTPLDGRILAESKPVSENGVKAKISSASLSNADKSSPEISVQKPALAQTTTTETSQTTNKSTAPILAAPYTDFAIRNRSKTNNVDGKRPAALSSPSNIGSEQPVLDSLDLRLASNRNLAGTKPVQAPEIDARVSKAPTDASMKIETKSSFMEMQKLSTGHDLETSIELSAPASVAQPASTQTVTQKTVGFDWNAPQFAERFAAEISDMRINGDLKKFEINPRNMGRLEVSFVSRGGVEVLQIEAESDAAREVIVQHSQAIQDILKAQGRSDLTLRVDVRDNMFAASQNDSMDFSQQNGAGEQEEHTASPSQNGSAAMTAEGDVDPPAPSDNSRYA
ncbi:MAG: hypothetical protein Pars93KO_25850 [Parasphingorhabdus sp.]